MSLSSPPPPGKSALASVPDYLHTPVYKAAQAVQHSADGYAYVQYQPEAAGWTQRLRSNVSC